MDDPEAQIYDYPGGKAKSRVWKVFGFRKPNDERPPTRDNLDMSKAVCRLCKKIYVNKGNTTNFQFHIDHDHTNDVSSSKSSRVRKIQSAESVQTKLNFNPRLGTDRQSTIDQALMKLLVGKVLPISLVDNPLFKAFVKLLDSRYSVPSRKDITKRLHKKQEEVQKKIAADMASCDTISITHDGWTSLNNESYDTVTSHFIDKTWSLKSAVLCTKKVNGSHTSENIANSLKETTVRWGLANSPLATTDNAANERKAFELLQWTRFGCYGHRINLVVKHALAVPEISKILGKGRKLVSFFHSSPSVTGELLRKQELLLSEGKREHKLIIDVATRWNSTLAMLERLCELTPAIMSLLVSEDTLSKAAVTAIKNNAYNFEEQALAERLITVLKPFQQATEILCSEKTPTIHKVIPVVVKLNRAVVENNEDPQSIKAVKRKMREELEKRTDSEEVSMMGCLLNPYTKDFQFLPSLKTEAHELLKKMVHVPQLSEYTVKVKEEHPEINNNLPVLPIEPPELQIEPSEKKAKLEIEEPSQITSSGQAKAADTEDWLDDVVCVGSSFEDQSNIAEQEVMRYLNTKVQPGLTVLQWWKTNEFLFPRLSILAKKFLSCQASSVPSERVFSLAGQIVSKKRCRLNPNLVDMTIFLNKNMTNYW